MDRIILHIDLDSFYASVEENRNPEIKGKPVVICMFSGRQDSGAVATANYEARKFGIKSGMYLGQARRLASKDTAFLPADREHYKQVSDRIMEIFRRHADVFEQRSIDEAYLDVSSVSSFDSAVQLAEGIKKEVLEQESLTCSVGIGPNKLVSKMASREVKPNGLTVVKQEEALDFLSQKPVKKLFGIGPKTLQSLEKFKIETIGDLSRIEKSVLQEEFGQTKGSQLFEHSRGIDQEPVQEIERQQLSRIATLPENTRDMSKISETLSSLSSDLHRKVVKEGISFKTVSIITISKTLETKTRSVTLSHPSNSQEAILENSRKLFEEFLKGNQDILRRIGVRVSSFDSNSRKKPIQRSGLSGYFHQ